MNSTTRRLITADILTLTEIADLLGISVFAARKRAERGGWDYVLKSGTRLYYRPDIMEHLKKNEP